MSKMKRLVSLLVAVLSCCAAWHARAGEVAGIRAQYFNTNPSSPDYTFSSPSVALDRIEPTINVNGITSAPADGVNSTYYLVRYTGYVLVPATGTYTFIVQAANGVRLYLDCNRDGSFDTTEKLIESWTSRSSVASFSASCQNQLTAGSRYALTYEFYQSTGAATARLQWSGPSPVGSTTTMIPAGNGTLGLTTQVSDSVAPTLVSARMLCGSANQVLVTFSEQVDSGSAQTIANYALTGGHTVSTATLQADGKSVLLTISPALSASQTLTVNNITDLAVGPANTTAANTSATVAYTATYTSGLTGTYYDQNATAGAFFTGNTVSRTDASVDFLWGTAAPVSGIPATDYSVRWTGAILVPTTGSYVFGFLSRNNARVWINGAYHAGTWFTTTTAGSSATTGSSVTLTAGTYIPITLEYFNRATTNIIQLVWKKPGSSSYVTIPSSQLFHCTSNPGVSFTIGTSSSGSTCGSTMVTLTALNADGSAKTSYTGAVSLSTSTGRGDWSAGSPAPNGTLTNGTADDGAATYTFNSADGGSVRLNLAQIRAQSFSITAADPSVSGSSSTSSTISVSGSNAFVFTEDAAGKIAGSNVAVASRPHDYTLTVTRGDSSSANCGTATDYTGSHSLKMWRTDSNGSWTAPTVVSPALTIPAAQPASSNITLNFSSGVASFNVGTTDIGRYSFSLQDDSQSYTSATISGTGNALTVRPFALVVSNLWCTHSYQNVPVEFSNLPEWGGPPFCRAGNSFKADVGAYRWASSMAGNGTDGNDDGLPDSTATLTNVKVGGLAPSFNSAVTLQLLAGSQVPSTGVLGTLSYGSSISGFSGGKATPSTLSYSEVGTFQLDSQSLVTNFLGSGLTLNGSLFTSAVSATSTSTIGRFAPARFAASNASVTLRPQGSCSPASTFNYLGEAFAISFTLTAQDALGNTTKNYTGSYAKLDLSGAGTLQLAGASGSTVFSATSSSPRLSLGSISAAWGNGTGTAAVTVSATAERASSPDGPFDATAGNVDATFGIAPVDSDYTAMGSFDLDADSSISGNDHKALVTVPLRFGRLRLQNVIMSRGLRASIPMVAQYWNGSAFVTNTLDSCTTVPASALNFGNYRLTMAASDTTVLAGSSTLTLSAGSGSIPLEPITSGHRGTFDIAVSLGSSATDYACLQPWTPGSGDAATAGAGLTYLRGAWCGSSYDRDPSARISYGLYRGADKLLHQRENY
jgi:hypothetical protein